MAAQGDTACSQLNSQPPPKKSLFPETGGMLGYMAKRSENADLIFILFTWLHQVLVVAHRVFYLHCSMQDLLVAACGI